MVAAEASLAADFLVHGQDATTNGEGGRECMESVASLGPVEQNNWTRLVDDQPGRNGGNDAPALAVEMHVGEQAVDP